MLLLGVDVGTTHCKAGLVARGGHTVSAASRPTVVRTAADGSSFFDPDELWQTVAATIREAVGGADPAQIAAVGLTSMAESGLLVDAAGGTPRSAILPWFDLSSAPQVVELERAGDGPERFRRSGLRPSFKFGLAKLLWLRRHRPATHHEAVWLSVADYVAFRLTGEMATDPSLAARTYCYRIDTCEWDDEWVRAWDFDPAMFPRVVPSGSPVGDLAEGAAGVTGLIAGTPVAISGHDHLCAAVAVGAHRPGIVFDSMGTAESLLGTLAQDRLGEAEYASGLSFGRHVAGDAYYWLGGLASSGGSIEWLRRQLGDPPIAYKELEALVALSAGDPSGILYFPYLSGSGTPWTDPRVRGAIVGLRAAHSRGDLVKAVLEGTAYEMEAIRRAGQQVSGTSLDHVVAVGGGTRIRPWLQIKADVSGCAYTIAAIDEAAVLGAAILAATGCGLFSSVDDAAADLTPHAAITIRPDPERHAAYRRIYEHGYLALQEPLRGYGRWIGAEQAGTRA